MNSGTNGTSGTNAAPESASTGLALRPPVESAEAVPFKRGLEPSSFDKAYQFATIIAQTGMCGVTSPEEALGRIMTGRELGLSAMQSLRGVYLVYGRPSLDASLMQALCMQHPDCERFEFVESTTEKAVLKVKRKGRAEQTITWTIEDAKRAELVKKDSNWMKYPAQMLRARCKADGSRLEFSDTLFGMMSVEETRDLGPAEHTAVPEVSGDTSAAIAEATAKAEQLKAGFLDRIAKTTGEELDIKALRDEIKAAADDGSLAGPHLAEVRKAYGAQFGKKKAAESKPEAPAAPAGRQSGDD